MNARIESMSHGDGKVYLQMVLDRMHPDAEVLLDARWKKHRRPIMWWCFLISMYVKLT